MVPPSSHRVSRVRRYSGYSWLSSSFVYGPLTLYGAPSHALQLDYLIPFAVLTPKTLLSPVWPPPRSLATTNGISVDVFSSPYLDVSVQAVPHVYLWIQYTLHRYESVRVAPFGNPRIYRLFTAPRGLSQLATSFFGSQCQGIPLALFLA